MELRAEHIVSFNRSHKLPLIVAPGRDIELIGTLKRKAMNEIEIRRSDKCTEHSAPR